MNESQQLHTLAVDIGGSGIKVMTLDMVGNPLAIANASKLPNQPSQKR